MAATFRPVNSSVPHDAAAISAKGDVMTSSPSPATPRPSTAPHPNMSKAIDEATTPTRATFSPSIAGQQRLPSSPLSRAAQAPGSVDGSQNGARQHSDEPQQRDSMDVDMDDSDGENGADDGAASDDDSVNADGSGSNKKKKSQRFYCTEFPPCKLSFTRSEHLARHIRKHTGERPFQCHCSRRFSRLDNLRQHAQTVHVNEDIPIDSLAATGSRFQRQMRTNDRVRQAGNRARASTSGSAGGPPRGHSKSLSTSSINSIGSVGSTYSTATDARRRPAPLVMADPRSRPMDTYRSNADGTYMYRPSSPSEFSTPTSSTFSVGQGSPRWGPGLASPTTSHSRSQSMYTSGSRTSGRRLSVPSAADPFQSQAPGRPVFEGSGPPNASNGGLFSSSSGGLVTSPTSSTISGWSGRRESTSSATEEAWKRRTWHPDSRSYHQNHHSSQLNDVASQSSMGLNPPPPIANPSNAKTTLRLPGIESFDLPRPPLPPSPIMADTQQRPSFVVRNGGDATAAEERRNLNVYDASLQRGLNRLDIGPNTPPRDSAGAWASEANQAVQAQSENTRVNAPVVRFEGQHGSPSYPSHGGPIPGQSLHQQTMSAPSLASTRESKRRGWYNGPVTSRHDEVQRSPQDPRAAHVDRMVHPNVSAFSGFPVREQQQAPQQQQQQQQQLQQKQIQHQPQHHYQHQYQLQVQQHQQPQQHERPGIGGDYSQREQHERPVNTGDHYQQQQHQQQERPVNGNDHLRRLEALVAVATSEGSTATAY